MIIGGGGLPATHAIKCRLWVFCVSCEGWCVGWKAQLQIYSRSAGSMLGEAGKVMSQNFLLDARIAHADDTYWGMLHATSYYLVN